MKIKDIFICALSALLLCSCTNTENVGELSENEAETVETNEAELTIAVKTTEAETTITEETEAEETPKNTFYSSDDRVQSYMEQLVLLDSFNEVLPQAADCLICDLDSNGTPEMVIQAAALISVSVVFSVDDEGAFMAEPAGGTAFTDEDTWRSYDGDIPQGFILDGKDQYFASCWVGGSVAGEGGIIQLCLNGRKLSSEYVGEYSYSSTMGFEYSGFENEKQYKEYLRSYFQKLEPQWKLLPHKDLIDIKEKTPNHISSLLEKYYNDRDSLARETLNKSSNSLQNVV